MKEVLHGDKAMKLLPMPSFALIEAMLVGVQEKKERRKEREDDGQEWEGSRRDREKYQIMAISLRTFYIYNQTPAKRAPFERTDP